MSGTSGTVKTDSALLTEFADGQAAGSITPQDVRDVIVSETSHVTSAINTALPIATASQLYGGTGTTGAAAPVSVGTGLSLSGSTLTATGGGGTSSPATTTVLGLVKIPASGGLTVDGSGNISALVAPDDPTNTSGLGAAAILRGTVNLRLAAGVTVGAGQNSTVRTANGTALQAALNYAATNKKYVELDSGTIEYITSTVDNAYNVGLQVKAGTAGFYQNISGSALAQFGTNQACLTFGGMSSNPAVAVTQIEIDGVHCGHGVDQTGQTLASGLILGGMYRCRVGRVLVDHFAGGGAFPPYDGILHTAGEFSNSYADITVYSAQRTLLNRAALGSGTGTGDTWGNVYLGGGTFGSLVTLSSSAINWNINSTCLGSTIDQLNVEWVATPQIMFIQDQSQISLRSVHFEGCKLTGFNPKIFGLSYAKVNVESLHTVDITISASYMGGTPVIYSTYGPCSLNVRGATHIWNGAGYNADAVDTVRLHVVDRFVQAGDYPDIRISQMSFGGNTGGVDLDEKTGGATYGEITDVGAVRYDRGLTTTENALLNCPSAGMTVYGLHRFAKVQYSSVMTANQTITLSDRMAGSGVGASIMRGRGDTVHVFRSGSATGAFNLNIAGPSGIVITTLTTAGSEALLNFDGAKWTVNGSAAPTRQAEIFSGGRFYLPDGACPPGTGAAPGANSIRMFLGYVKTKMNGQQFTVRCTTAAASGNIQCAIYAADPTSLLPTGAALYTSIALSTTSTGALTDFTTGNVFLDPGYYWFATNCDTSGGAAVFVSGSSASANQALMYGATAVGNALNTTGLVTGLSLAQTYGTWPSMSGQTFADVATNSVPLIALKIF